MTMTPCRRRRGFTLIELLVVITIIALLAGLAFPAISAALTAAKKAEASTMINQLRVALTAYQTEYGNWPLALQGANDVAIDSSNSELYETLIAKKRAAITPATISAVWCLWSSTARC
ncbi:MAG: type II secretion system protein [Blastochloris sp.]|nr:type II secretion system protein [Blastochloris sp.]